MDRETIQDMDAVLRRAGRPRERQIVAACMVTAAQLAASLRPDETVLLIAHSGGGQLCVCAVNSGGQVALWIAPEDSWSEVRFRRWQRRFPSGYRFAGAPGGNGWSRKQLQETVKGLGIYFPTPPSRLTVIPSADLFLFPFAMVASWHPSSDVASASFLTPAATDSFLGVSAVISTAPSPQWLITTRAAAPSRHIDRRVWIGSPDTTDETLRELRKGLRWQFQAHGIRIIEGERPTGLAGASLAIVIAHGVQAEGREFHALSDGVNSFSPTEVASWLEGCACVVIAVCHGGAATAQAHSHETRGLVSAILAVGVQAVIACPWPLGSDVVRSWIPAFLQSLASGKTVDDAAFAAAGQVRKHLADAAAGVAMQVFGDGGMTVAAHIPSGD